MGFEQTVAFIALFWLLGAFGVMTRMLRRGRDLSEALAARLTRAATAARIAPLARIETTTRASALRYASNSAESAPSGRSSYPRRPTYCAKRFLRRLAR